MRKALLVLIIFGLGRTIVSGCGWDWDTIQMEKKQFPSIHELITGKFLRHSQEFYYWRVKDRSEKLILYPDSIPFYDDLAWAYDKIGEHEKAIETMLLKDSLFPGLYETYANLGTSYIHNGDLEDGLTYIKKAIEINPEAHFGREVYQQYLVEYILEKQDSLGNFSLPLSVGNSPDFYTFLKNRHFKTAYANGSTKSKEISKAVKGIAGMMKFGQYNSPILLEVLGDLLYAAESGYDPGAGHLGARAYLKAAFETKDPDISKQYEMKAMLSVERVWADHGPGSPQFEQSVYPLRNLAAVLKIEILSAETWYEEIRNNELSWISAGINPDSAFAANYYDEPEQEYIYESNSAIFDKVDEEAWMKLQMQRPDHIRYIHQVDRLDDSTRLLLDSLYNQEFRIIPEETPEAEKNKKDEEADDDSFGSISIYWILGLLGVLMLVFLLLRFRGKRG